MKVFLSFFRFYYYLVRRNRKIFNIVNNPNESLAVLITPVVIFTISIVLSIALVSGLTTALMMLSAMWVVVNLILFHKVKQDDYLEKRKKREEADRRKHEEEMRKIDEIWERAYRKHLEEEERIRQEREFERAYRRFRDTQEATKRTDQNLENALKLMGLKHNFNAKDVKTAYRRLSKIHHPDLGGLQANFVKLTKAYGYLNSKL